MFCRICGKPIPDNSTFCSNCGASTLGQPSDSIAESALYSSGSSAASPQTVIPAASAEHSIPASCKQTARKKSAAAFIFAAISVLLAATLLLSFLGILPSPFRASSASFAADASQSFATPEEAIESFVSFLKAGDYDDALSTCAIENVSSRFVYKQYVEHVTCIPPFGQTYLPADYPEFVAYNKYSCVIELISKMITFSSTLNLSEDNAGFLSGDYAVLQSDEQLEDFIEQLNPANIEALEIVDIGSTSMQNDEKTQEIIKMQAQPYGADDMLFRSVLYRYNGSYYLGGFTLLEYDGKWQIFDLSDPSNGLGSGIVLAPLPDESSFQDILDN